MGFSDPKHQALHCTGKGHFAKQFLVNIVIAVGQILGLCSAIFLAAWQIDCVTEHSNCLSCSDIQPLEIFRSVSSFHWQVGPPIALSELLSQQDLFKDFSVQIYVFLLQCTCKSMAVRLQSFAELHSISRPSWTSLVSQDMLNCCPAYYVERELLLIWYHGDFVEHTDSSALFTVNVCLRVRPAPSTIEVNKKSFF